MDRENLLDWISLTCVCLAFVVSYIICKSWDLGRDYIIDGNRGKRLNFIQKWFDGLRTFIKM